MIDEFKQSFSAILYMIEQKIDFSKYGEKPIKTQLRQLQQFDVSDTFSLTSWIEVRYNSIFTWDDFIGLAWYKEWPDGFLDLLQFN